jgi:hypothetical protein
MLTVVLDAAAKEEVQKLIREVREAEKKARKEEPEK